MTKEHYIFGRQNFRKIPLTTKKLILYEEEPYFSNTLNSMAKNNWVLVSTKRLKQEFSFNKKQNF